MTVPVIFSKILTAAKNAGGKTLLIAKQHAPEICIGAGVAGFLAEIPLTVKATNKTHDILDEKKADIEKCTQNLAYHVERNDTIEYSREDYEQDIKRIKRRTRKKLIRAWIPVGTTGAGSVISVLGGYKILNGRYVATTAAYKVLESGFDRYRSKVAERFGAEVDKELYTLKADEVEEECRKRDEAEKKATEGRGKKKSSWEKCGQIMIFDDHSERWQRYWTAQQVLEFLHLVENQMNDLLRLRGHLFLNEINDRLGLPRTKNGQVEGWWYSKQYNPDSHVDLIGNLTEAQIREILSTTRNDEIRVPLYPNVEGIVYDLIGVHDGDLEP